MAAPAELAHRDRWQPRLAPLFESTPERPIGPHQVLLAIAAVAVGAAVSLFRQPGIGPFDTVWAEDGQIFLADAVNRSPVEALAGSYAGYFHTAPRLLAFLAAAAPPDAAGTVLAVSAAVVTAALALLVYVASAGQLPSRAARVAVAAVVIVAPLAQDDVPNSIANLHWPALYALFWVLLWTPARKPARVVAVATVALVATSDILVVALLPLAVARLVVRRDRHSATLAGVLAAGFGLQLLGLLTGTSSRDLDLNPVRPVTGFLWRAVPAALVGSDWLGDDHTSIRWLGLAALGWLLVLAAVVAGWRRLTRPAWLLAAVAAIHSGALYALPVFLSGVATERYALAPAMLVVVAMLALLPPSLDRPGAAGVALLAILAVVCAVNLRVPNARAEGPSWNGELDRARQECAQPGGSGETRVWLPPGGPWHADLPCDYLARE
ncbi:MAG TPA: hypothetical protein VIL37_15050 [Natronosporangium sp.]